MFSRQLFAAASSGPSLLPAPFHCTSSRDGAGAVRVEASGELDVLTTPELVRALRKAAVESPRLVVLDLRALTFIDSTGVHAIQDARSHARLRGGKLVVSRVPTYIARILALAATVRGVAPLDAGERPEHMRPVGGGTLEA